MKLISKILLCSVSAIIAFSLISCTHSNSTTFPAETTAPHITEPPSTNHNTFNGQIDWVLQGIWMTENGQTGDSINFSLNGTLPVDYELHKNAEMELNFIWPEALGYRNEGRRSCIGLVDVADRHNGQVLYLGVDWIYDPQINELHSFTFMICPKDGFVVIHIENKFLIASTDPNSEPSEILAFYKEYVR